jgi:CHAT domain-containing protein
VQYPIIFPDRVELLLETSTGLARYRSEVAGPQVRAAATAFAADLRNGSTGYMARARQLYDWLLRPLDAALAAQRIDTLVVVPDGALRLVPFGALHDGSSFAIERLALATVTGMSMTNTTTPPRAAQRALVAGAAEFGPVVGKFMQTTVGQRFITQLGTAAPASRGIKLRTLRAPPDGAIGNDVEKMRQSLTLPGVAREVEMVSAQLSATSMLDAGFTVARFSSAVQADNFAIVHVASHGMFGGSGASSFVLAYDDLLTLDGLQALLRSDKFRRHPIELLTLSACETADGNERAPLGMSGAAMKARAKSVLGALWPVEDEAAVTVMGRFYGAIANGQHSKAQALRGAQLELMRNPALAHPGFWAPFTLIGNWL